MSIGMTGTAVMGFDNAIVRAADEGVPIAALKRIFKGVLDALDLRELLAAAVRAGRLVCLPKEDWPPYVPRDARAPTVPDHDLGTDDVELSFKMARVMKTTKLESSILLVVLRRGYAAREQLHDAVEANRGNPAETTQEKIVDVVVCKLRKKLAPLGLKLDTVHSRGYQMSDDDRKKAWEMINGG